MFRFTIRDVLWLTVVVGLACGWALEANRSRVDWRKVRSREAGFIEMLRLETLRADSEARTNEYYERVLARGGTDAAPNP